ncbi:unnamed protein product, partial [Nesidiocoris tenuis]
MGDHSIKFDRGSPGNVTIIGSVVTKPGSKWMYGNISGGRDPGPSGGTAPSVSRQLNWLPILSEPVAITTLIGSPVICSRWPLCLSL